MNNDKNTNSAGIDDIKVKKDSDLQDSQKDQEKLALETFTIELPDVKDIPGQEFIHPMPLGEMSDITVSSDDEEGVGILDDEEDLDITDTDSNVSGIEKRVLQQADEDMPTTDEIRLRNATLDNTDNDGTVLNENTVDEVSGKDLDVPGAEADDTDEEMGEEDEENNEYSLGADKD